MISTAIEQPNTDELQQTQSAVIYKANEIEIASQIDLELASDFLRSVKTYQKQVIDTFGGAKSAAYKAHREISATEKRFLDPLKVAESTVKSKVVVYQREQEKIRRAEQERLQAEARKAEEDRRLAEAERLEAAGHPKAAEEVVSAPIPTPVVVAPPAVAKVDGISTRKVWRFKVVDARVIPAAYMLPNDKAIGEYARAMKENANMPGVEFFSEDVVSAKSHY